MIFQNLPHLRRQAWLFVSRMMRWWYIHVYGVDIGKEVVISHRAYIDKGVPGKIHIGNGSRITARVTILGHDHSRSLNCHTYIGANCIIGCNAIIMPGIHIGDSSVIGAGCVVTKDVPPHSLAVGNPMRIVKCNVVVQNGRIVSAGERI